MGMGDVMVTKGRGWRRRVMGYLFLLVGLYVVYCGLLFFFQTKLIFPASMAGPAGKALPTADTEVIELPTDQGTTTAWFVPAADAGSGLDLDADANQAKPVVVFFHGNAELIDHQRAVLDLYHDLGIHVLLVEYRGYGYSEGTPSERNIVADSVAVIEEVLQRDDVAEDQLILHGRSIGGGMAAQVALKTKPAALIVESTFTSVSGMAMRFGVPPFIVTSPLKTEAAFGKLDVPTLIMHGQRDSIVPISHAHRLKQAAAHATLVMFDSDHNDLPSGAEVATYLGAVREHLEQAGVLR